MLASCGEKNKLYSDPVTGASNLNQLQYETIASLGKSVEGKKLVVTLSADSFDDHIEYYAVNFNENGTYTRITYQFYYLESSYVEAQVLIDGNDYYEILEQDRESFILIFKYSDSSGIESPVGNYGEIKSGYENDTMKEYIIVE